MVVAGGTIFNSGFRVFDLKTGQSRRLGLPLLDPNSSRRSIYRQGLPERGDFGRAFIHPPNIVRFVRPDIVAVTSTKWKRVRCFDISQDNEEVHRWRMGAKVRFMDANPKGMVVYAGDTYHWWRFRTGTQEIRTEEEISGWDTSTSQKITAIAVGHDGFGKLYGDLGWLKEPMPNPACVLKPNTPYEDTIAARDCVSDLSYHPIDYRVYAAANTCLPDQCRGNEHRHGPIRIERIAPKAADVPDPRAVFEDQELLSDSDYPVDGLTVSVAFNRDGSKVAYTVIKKQEGEEKPGGGCCLTVHVKSITKTAEGSKDEKWALEDHCAVNLRIPDNYPVGLFKKWVGSLRSTTKTKPAVDNTAQCDDDQKSISTESSAVSRTEIDAKDA